MFRRVIWLTAVTIVAWAGAFGISYAVFEWRDSDDTGNTSAIEQRIDELEGKVSAESDTQKCAAALAAVNDTPRTLGGIRGVTEGTPNPVYETITDLIDRYCR